MRATYFLFTLYLVLQFADALSTYIAVSTGGGKEANPFMSFIFSRVGVVSGLVFTKLLAIAPFCFILNNWLAPYMLVIMDASYVWVVWNNSKVIHNG